MAGIGVEPHGPYGPYPAHHDLNLGAHLQGLVVGEGKELLFPNLEVKLGKLLLPNLLVLDLDHNGTLAVLGGANDGLIEGEGNLLLETLIDGEAGAGNADAGCGCR